MERAGVLYVLYPQCMLKRHSMLVELATSVFPNPGPGALLDITKDSWCILLASTGKPHTNRCHRFYFSTNLFLAILCSRFGEKSNLQMTVSRK